MRPVLTTGLAAALRAGAGGAQGHAGAGTDVSGAAARNAHAHNLRTAHARRVRRYLVHRGPGRNDWTVICEDEAGGPPDCRIETVLKQAAPAAPAASIASADGGKSWMVAASPSPGAARLQVGQRAPIDADCTMPGDACAITGEAAERLTHDFQAGARLSAHVLTAQGELDRNVSLQGFSNQLTKLRTRLPPDAGQGSPAAPPAPSPSAATPAAPAPASEPAPAPAGPH